MRLFPTIGSASPLAYCVVHRPECAGMTKLAAFRDWLLAQAVLWRRERFR
ncbi:hypothetical protein [Burkholderia sp.]|nr:hypothetical protein [Burkholderia sp.]